MDAQPVDKVHNDGWYADHSGKADQIALTGVLPQNGVQPACQKADNIYRHDPRQVCVQNGTVVGPPCGFHCTVCTQQQRKIKAECNDGCIQQHKQRPARKHLRRVLFIFHKKVLFYIRHKSRSFGRKSFRRSVLPGAPDSPIFILYSEHCRMSRKFESAAKLSLFFRSAGPVRSPERGCFLSKAQRPCRQ